MRVIVDIFYGDQYGQAYNEMLSGDGIEFISKGEEECDLYVVVDKNPHAIKTRCPDGGLWLVHYEPPVDIYSYYKENYPYYDLINTQWQDIDSLNIPGKIVHDRYFINSTFALRPQPAPLTKESFFSKQDRVSAILSNANSLPGHKFRQKLITFLQSKKFDYDHYGFGYNYIQCKSEGLDPYKYSIAVENSAIPFYVTEKIADCFARMTMPIYWGCPNITEYFPAESMIIIDEHDLEGSLERIEEAVRTDLWSKNFEALVEAHNRVFEEHAFGPYLRRLISKYYSPTSAPRLRSIPALLSPKERKLSYKIKNKLGIYRLKQYLKEHKHLNARKSAN